MSKNINEVLDTIESRANAATPGPWRVNHDDAEECGPHAHSGLAMVEVWPLPFADKKKINWPPARLCEWPTAEFIAHARQDIPALVRVVRWFLDNYVNSYQNQKSMTTEEVEAEITAILTQPPTGDDQGKE